MEFVLALKNGPPTILRTLGESAVKIVNLKNDLEDAQEWLGEDQKFTAELKKGCATAQTDYESRVKGRAEELDDLLEDLAVTRPVPPSPSRRGGVRTPQASPRAVTASLLR